MCRSPFARACNLHDPNNACRSRPSPPLDLCEACYAQSCSPSSPAHPPQPSPTSTDPTAPTIPGAVPSYSLPLAASETPSFADSLEVSAHLPICLCLWGSTCGVSHLPICLCLWGSTCGVWGRRLSFDRRSDMHMITPCSASVCLCTYTQLYSNHL